MLLQPHLCRGRALGSSRGSVVHELCLYCPMILLGMHDVMRRRHCSDTARRGSRGSVGEQLISKDAIWTGVRVVRFRQGDAADC